MKIPESAKKVFSGVIFDVYQWQQEMFDGSYQTFERLKRPHASWVIPVLDNGLIAISKQEQPGLDLDYHLYGGRAEEGESPLTTAQRELLEESGLVSDDWELFTVYEPDTKIDFVFHIYIARNCHRVAQPHLDAGEKVYEELVNFDTFLQIGSESFYIYIRYDLLKISINKNSKELFKKRLGL